jgi:SPOR domain
MWTRAIPFLALILGEGAAFAQVIDLETQCPGGVQAGGLCSPLFSTAGNAQTLNISTSIGTVVFRGGVLLDNAANVPADETAIYATAGNGDSTGAGFSNPITITFPRAIANFFVTVINGTIEPVTYQVADELGNGATFDLPPNISGAQNQIGFAARGSVVTIKATTGLATPDGIAWDFAIDNVTFNQPLPPGLNPISTTAAPRRETESTGPVAGSTYLQLAATSKHEADAYVQVLRRNNFPALDTEIPEKPGMFRVLVGPMAPGDADRIKADLQGKGIQADAAIRRTF